MPSCALCENVQPAGDACEVCGHPFPARERVDVRVDPLEDMEATLLPSTGDAGEVPAFEGLETTSVEGIPDDGPSAEAIIAICRYCRTPGFPREVFCAHCGMRLPAIAGAQAAALGAVLCRDCGTPLRRESCPVCGVRPSR